MKLNIKHGFILAAFVTSQLLHAQNKITKPQTTITKTTAKDTAAKDCCSKNIPSRFPVSNTPKSTVNTGNSAKKIKTGMVWIEGGTFAMGGDNNQARADEFPKHVVQVSGFFMDETEVTNQQFEAFVKATGYITTAEKDVDWEVLKKQLPANTPKPDSEMLKAASLVFKPTTEAVDLQDYGQWWKWTHQANWRHPQGPNSTIVGKENYPVVHICWEDANAYCKWADKRLPTEAEWEFAARGGLKNMPYSWGKEAPDSGKLKCNYWQGNFPYLNTNKDGFYGAAPVKSFAPNGYGLYDMSGNVWEWCADLYNYNYYATFKNIKLALNPNGPQKSYDPDEPLVSKRVMRGGSFLCSDSYCSGYRSAARMKSSEDSGMEHLGFRCVSSK
jgi:sulfatase modifying factor 1